MKRPGSPGFRPRIALIAAFVAACTTAPTPIPTPLPAPTPTERAGTPIRADLRPGELTGQWYVIGLAENDSANALRNPSVRLVVRDGSGSEIARRTAGLGITLLPAGSRWPFSEAFDLGTGPASVEAHLLGGASQSSPPALRAEVLTRFIDLNGRPTVLGRLTLGTGVATEIEAIRLLGTTTPGEFAIVLDAVPAVGRLAAGDQAPFLARLPAEGEDLKWEAFAVGRASQGAALHVRVDDLEPRLDDQGNPFLTGRLMNESDGAVQVRITALLTVDNKWSSAAGAELPLPLMPGEEAAFALRAPATDGEIEWRVFLGATPAAVGPIPLAPEVIGFESAGSNLHLRVRVDAGTNRISAAAAYVSLIGEGGRLASAGWSATPAALGPGEAVVVTVSVPLPAGFDLARAEFEVRAAGLPASHP